MNKKKQKIKAAKQLQIWFMGRPKALKEGLISVAGFNKAKKALENANVPVKTLKVIKWGHNPYEFSDESRCDCSDCQRFAGPAILKNLNSASTRFEKMRFWLEKKGFKKIGSGAYGVVFGRDNSDKVIKLIRDPGRDGWVEYIQWAKQNKFLGSFAPRVDSYKFIKDGERGFGMAVMERLDKTFYNIPRKEDAHFVQEAMMQALHGNDLAAKFLALHKPGSEKFMLSFKEKFGDYGDFHSGNWMTRKDGTVVLIDPLSRPGQSNYKERIKTA